MRIVVLKENDTGKGYGFVYDVDPVAVSLKHTVGKGRYFGYNVT